MPHTPPAPQATAPRAAALPMPQAAPSLVEQVYAAILEAICGGTLQPGDRINQDELAARLNVSRQPVTQALTVLRSQDFVRDAGRRGLVVTPLDKRFFESLYELRESLDPMAARLAARRGVELSRTEAEALLAAGRDALAQGSVAALTSADMAFHMWLYEASGNPLLADTLRLYWHHLRRAMGAVVQPQADRARVWEEHGRILQAVLDGDGAAAERLSAQHIRAATPRVMQGLPGA